MDNLHSTGIALMTQNQNPTQEKNLSENAISILRSSVSVSGLTINNISLIKKVLGFYCQYLKNDKDRLFYIEIINYISSAGHINIMDVPAIKYALDFIKIKFHERIIKSKGVTKDDCLMRNIYRDYYCEISDIINKI
jgi:hypothetical protein